jgi:TonB family protein
MVRGLQAVGSAMMKTLGLCLAACTSYAVPAPSSARVIPTATGFPPRISLPDLPTTRELSSFRPPMGPITTRLGVCVTASGETKSVELRRSSGDRAFDRAIVHDVAAWRYQPLEAGALACEQATVTFVP